MRTDSTIKLHLSSKSANATHNRTISHTRARLSEANNKRLVTAARLSRRECYDGFVASTGTEIRAAARPLLTRNTASRLLFHFQGGCPSSHAIEEVEQGSQRDKPLCSFQTRGRTSRHPHLHRTRGTTALNSCPLLPLLPLL